MKKILFGLCGLIAVLLLLGCTSAPQEEKFKIGAILPLTGELSDQGQS
jgi:hypothetical protein